MTENQTKADAYLISKATVQVIGLKITCLFDEIEHLTFAVDSVLYWIKRITSLSNA